MSIFELQLFLDATLLNHCLVLICQFQESERHLLDDYLGDGRSGHQSDVFLADHVSFLARYQMNESHLTELRSNRVTANR